MNQALKLVAFDLGASGGTVQLGEFDGSSVALKEIYRFPNGPVLLGEHIYWDFLRLFEEVKTGLKLANRTTNGDISCMGLDTWGTDCALLNKNGVLVENPHSYRDPRTNGMMEKVFKRIPKKELYFKTGVQFMQLNTIFQLYSMIDKDKRAFDGVGTFFMVPDLFNYFLSGVKACEYTNATTTQFFDPQANDWSKEILKALDIPHSIMVDIIPPGTILGNMSDWICGELVIDPFPVISVATHDTASAVSVVPNDMKPHAFLSSGTWSLLGSEEQAPVINEQGYKNNFSCYGGACGRYLVWKNIQALWLLQESMREWKEEGKEYSHEDVILLANQSKEFKSLIDTDSIEFLTPGYFPRKIYDFCKNTNQPTPNSDGEIARCILESLALKYRFTFERLQEVIGEKLEKVYIIGGGARNILLNQFTSNALGIPVEAGLFEATSLGNIMMQLIAIGEVASLEESRDIIQTSFKTSTHEPDRKQRWDDAYERYLEIIQNSITFNKT